MSHGTVGVGTRGLSKGLVMALVLLVRPLTEDKPLNFQEAWYALDVGDVAPLHYEIVHILNSGVTRYFWVRSGLGYGLLFG